MVIGAAGPQAQNVRAVFVYDLVGIHTVAQGFVHGAAFAVHGPAVGQALLKGCALAQSAHSGEQAGLEPAAVLVEPFQIHVRRPEALIPLHGGEVGGAGVKPAVQGIFFFCKGLAAAVGAGEAFG